MDAQEKHPGEQVKHLERCINDLISMMALPVLWTGGDPSQIARTLIDVLQRMLHLQLIYVQLKDPPGEVTLELARVENTPVPATQPREVGAQLNRFLGDDPQKWPSRIQGRFGDTNLSIVPLRLGLHGEIGMLVAGAERSDFPGRTEELLLRVAANQAVIALHEARLHSEQKRLADELDQRSRAANEGTRRRQSTVATASRPAATDSRGNMDDPAGWITRFRQPTVAGIYWPGDRACLVAARGLDGCGPS